MSIALVTTTIHIPYVLEKYAEDARKHGFDDLQIIVIGDYKSPSGTREFCSSIGSKFQLTCTYLDVSDQKKFTESFPELDNLIPFNCVQRRNIGLLLAYLEGHEILVTIDDDNFLHQANYFGAHSIVGQTVELPAYSSTNGWLNVCDFLEERNGRKFYPRGHSLAHRDGTERITSSMKQGRVVANAGLWLGDPDIDAMTRLAIPIDVTEYSLNHPFCLAGGTYAPINSQNTALHRSVLPAYFLAPHIGRLDDIWAGYFLKRIADHLGDRFAFGFPLVKQVRNEHNLWDDFEAERVGLELTDIFCQTLDSIKLNGSDYFACATELVEGLNTSLESTLFSLRNECVFYLGRFIKGYTGWLKVFANTSCLTK